MKRHAAKFRPKHVRRLLARLAAAGITDVLVQTGRAYLLTWRVGTAALRIAVSKSGHGFDLDGTWAAVRALFRARGLEVPA